MKKFSMLSVLVVLAQTSIAQAANGTVLNPTASVIPANYDDAALIFAASELQEAMGKTVGIQVVPRNTDIDQDLRGNFVIVLNWNPNSAPATTPIYQANLKDGWNVDEQLVSVFEDPKDNRSENPFETAISTLAASLANAILERTVEHDMSLALNFIDKGDANTAVALLDRAARLLPNNSNTLFLYGVALLDQNRQNVGRQVLQQAIKVGASATAAMVMLSVAQERITTAAQTRSNEVQPVAMTVGFEGQSPVMGLLYMPRITHPENYAVKSMNSSVMA